MEKMFFLDGEVLSIILPQGHTMAELNVLANQELEELMPQLFGKNLKINGRCTTALALSLGHTLAHVCKSVSIFDPKENAYVMCISH